MAVVESNQAPVIIPTHKTSSVAALFGDDSDSQPLWFKKDTFTDNTFDSESYISDLRRYVPFDTLRTELKSHLAALKSELVELINRDYTDFVNLSTKLVDVDGAVLRMRMPLSDLRVKLLAIKESVQAALAALQGGLERRAQASAARHMLELLLDTSHVLSKVEKLLLELEGMGAEDGRLAESGAGKIPLGMNGTAALREAGVDGGTAAMGLEESRSRLLERIASEMNRLKFYVARAQDLPFVQAMEKRIRAAEEALAAQLRQCLENSLERRDEAVLFHCLRAYAALDNTAGAEEAFRGAVVAPQIATILPPLPAKSAAAQAGSNMLAPIYAELEHHVEVDCRFLLNLASAANSGLHSFDFLSNSILREVHVAIQHSRPGAFSPGKLEEFLANYKASLNFLSFLEGYCPSQAMVVAFRQHPAYADFMKQWNLGVYFNLRFREIAGALDAALTTPIAAVSNKSVEQAPKLALQASCVLWESLLRCWHEDVFISSVSDKFLRLTLQLLSRYTAWLDAGLAARKLQQSDGASGGEWGLVASAEDFVLVQHDVGALAAAVEGPELAGILPLLLGPAVPADVQEASQQIVVAAAKSLLQRVEGISDVLTDVVAEKCVEVLRQLKGITATYRMTNKPLPVRHSHYVLGVLQPLRGFIDGERATCLSQQARRELITWVAERVTSRYDEMARELVTMARKTEESLLRLRRDRRGATADPSISNISDTDKITMQLFLDVQEYGRQLARFNVNPGEVPSYVSLWQCVAPTDQQKVNL